MTDDEYIAFLKALAVKHLSKDVRHPGPFSFEHTHTLRRDLETVSRLVRLFKVVVDRPEDSSLVDKFFHELTERSPVDLTMSALRVSNLAEALDDAGEVVLAELRRMSIPNDDVIFLRQAGFTDDEVEVFLSVVVAEAHRLAVGTSTRVQTRHLPEEFKALVSKFPEPKELAQSTKNKRKLFNGIGKILGGSVAGIGNALMATGTIMAPNPATAYGAIASAGIAVSGIFAGIGDLRGE